VIYEVLVSDESMTRQIKGAQFSGSSEEIDKILRSTVETILSDVRSHGGAAVRKLSAELDKWDPVSFCLSREQTEEIVASVPSQVISDIRFAQQKIRRFAEVQRSAIRDVEVETLPGVVLGHKNIPVDSVGCYISGGRYPVVASAHMSILTAKVAGVMRVIGCTPPERILPGAVALGGILAGLLYIVTTMALLVSAKKQDITAIQGIIETVGYMTNKVGIGWIIGPFALLLTVSIAGIGSVWLGGSARIPFVAGLDSYLPGWMGRIHPKYATPYAALITHATVSMLLVAMNFAGAGIHESFQAASFTRRRPSVDPVCLHVWGGVEDFP